MIIPDAIDLASTLIVDAPADIASWPVTSTISALTMAPSADSNPGLSFDFDASARWPNYTPPGWTGPLQYTVWPVVFINGQWVTSGIIQMWQGRASTGAPILTDFAKNWVYAARWAPLTGYQPVVGEKMGFFLSAGNARDGTGVTSVRERTNVVAVNLPAGDSGHFPFISSAPPVVPPVVPPVAPQDNAVAIAAIQTRLDEYLQVLNRLLIAVGQPPAPTKITFPNYTTTLFGAKVTLTPGT